MGDPGTGEQHVGRTHLLLDGGKGAGDVLLVGHVRGAGNGAHAEITRDPGRGGLRLLAQHVDGGHVRPRLGERAHHLQAQAAGAADHDRGAPGQ
ncbi:MAG: hypothetical protein NVSMB65_19540 [Chloroflexota bacterium]